MTLFTGIIAYILIWWTTLFAVLPWGQTKPDAPEVGHAASAPDNPHLRLKFIATALVAAVLWLALYIAVDMAIIDFRTEAALMMEEDLSHGK